MSLRSKAKRWTYLVHRWLGIGGCVLMALWFASGMVMLFIGYPKLTPGERLAGLPALQGDPALRPVSSLPAELRQAPERLALTTVRGEPAYVVRGGAHPGAWSAHTGKALATINAAGAARAAAQFSNAPATGAAVPIDEDRWTHSRGLDGHRPLYRVDVGGAQAGVVYVSSRTGEVVLDAPQYQQRWNHVGAWLHWLYPLRMKSVDPVWTWTVIVLSALCTMAAMSGVLVGVWRWRFRGRYRSGAKTPYVEPWMRWHHLLGLATSAFVFLWIFSGLMSMNPGKVFSSSHAAVDEQRYRGASAAADPAVDDPSRLLRALARDGMRPVELQWRRVAGTVFAVALDGSGTVRVVVPHGAASGVSAALPGALLRDAAGTLVDAPVRSFSVLQAPDAYFYARAPEAMNGALVRRFPVARVQFADPEQTRVYLDLATGDPLLVMGRRERIGRWLFNFLHSWDLPPMLQAGAGRTGVLIVLSLGGLALCVTAVVIGWRRLRR